MVNNKSSENVWLVISKYLVLCTFPTGVLVVVLDVPDIDEEVKLLLLNTTPRGENSIEQSEMIPKARTNATELGA